MTEPLDSPTTIRHFNSEAAALADLIETSEIDAPVPTCPGWTVSKLASHVGTVHRWATAIVGTGAHVDPKTLDLARPARDAGAHAWAAWLREGATTLSDVLAAAHPLAPNWTWANGDSGTNAWWTRRMLHETAVHRIDAELALGNDGWVIEAAVAVDAIDEHLANVAGSASFSAGVVNLLHPGERSGQSLHFHATDIEGEWMIELNADGFTVAHGHGKGTVAARGTARDLLAALTNRSTNHDGLELFGDATLFDWWTLNSPLS